VDIIPTVFPNTNHLPPRRLYPETTLADTGGLDPGPYAALSHRLVPPSVTVPVSRLASPSPSSAALPKRGYSMTAPNPDLTERRVRRRPSSAASTPEAPEEAPPRLLPEPSARPKRSIQLTLPHFWQRRASSYSSSHSRVAIPLSHACSPDHEDCALPPPPKRGRVGPDGVVRLGIG
jgi:hypothetical protein